MTATKGDIEGWLSEAKRQGATHLLVMCDGFDHENYPVYVMPGTDPREEGTKRTANMQRVDECYSMAQDIPAQLSERRAFHYD